MKLRTISLSFVLISGCASTTVPDDNSDTSSTGNVEPNTYVLDFTTSEQGGVLVGGNLNLAFTIDLQQRTRLYTMKAVGSEQIKPGLLTTNDFARCGQSDFLESNAKRLEAGEPGNVVYVEVEMLAGDPADPLGNYCFGYRVPNEGWKWAYEPLIPVSYDEATDRLRVRINIDKGPIDGMKLMTDTSKRGITTISYVVEP